SYVLLRLREDKGFNASAPRCRGRSDYRLVQTVDGKTGSPFQRTVYLGMWKYCCRNGRICLQVLTNYN
ncbi:MAG: hypothetical protein ACLVL2_12915, partial [Bacteroides cellulosilyticus]